MRERMSIVSPSCGLGMWNQTSSVGTVPLRPSCAIRSRLSLLRSSNRANQPPNGMKCMRPVRPLSRAYRSTTSFISHDAALSLPYYPDLIPAQLESRKPAAKRNEMHAPCTPAFTGVQFPLFLNLERRLRQFAERL